MKEVRIQEFPLAHVKRLVGDERSSISGELWRGGLPRSRLWCWFVRTGMFGTGVQSRCCPTIQQSRAICSALVFNLWPIGLYCITSLLRIRLITFPCSWFKKTKKTIHKAIRGIFFPPRLWIYITGVCCVISVRYGRLPHGFEIYSYIRKWETQRGNLRKCAPF